MPKGVATSTILMTMTNRICLGCRLMCAEFMPERDAKDRVSPYCLDCVRKSQNIIPKPLDPIRLAKDHWTDIGKPMTNSNRKGKRGELEAAKALHSATGLVAHRTAQVDGKLSADLAGIDGLHIEVKRRKKIAATNFLVQAETDAADNTTPLVIMREDGDTNWCVLLRLTDLIDLTRLLTNAGSSNR